MAPSLPRNELTAREGQVLLRLAWSAIRHCLEAEGETQPETVPTDGFLGEPRGAFVTLTREGILRGCIGTVEPSEPLAATVADCARGAALRDPRFPSVTLAELPELALEVSVLSALRAMEVASRRELLRQLQPGTDGLLLKHGKHRSTFLPQVWEQLPVPEEFLRHLLVKAKLPGDYWSCEMRFYRYRSVSYRQTGRALDTGRT